MGRMLCGVIKSVLQSWWIPSREFNFITISRGSLFALFPRNDLLCYNYCYYHYYYVGPSIGPSITLFYIFFYNFFIFYFILFILFFFLSVIVIWHVILYCPMNFSSFINNWDVYIYKKNIYISVNIWLQFKQILKLIFLKLFLGNLFFIICKWSIAK